MDLLAVLSGFGVGGGSLMTPLLATLGDVEWGLLTALLLGAGIKVLAWPQALIQPDSCTPTPTTTANSCAPALRSTATS